MKQLRKKTRTLEQLFENEMAEIMEQIRREHLVAEELIIKQVKEEDFISRMRQELGWLQDISNEQAFMRIYYYNKIEGVEHGR